MAAGPNCNYISVWYGLPLCWGQIYENFRLYCTTVATGYQFFAILPIATALATGVTTGLGRQNIATRYLSKLLVGKCVIFYAWGKTLAPGIV